MISAKNITHDKKQQQVISRKRVADHGEVYTATREVNAMLDLVKQETENIESTFLEPACGTGNFLAEILERKLRIVESRYGKSQLEYERYAVLAVSSLYGIDILEDNAIQCRNRLLDIFNKNYTRLYQEQTREDCRKTVDYILKKNIVWGDARDLKTVGNNPHSIIFSEWKPVNGNMLKRRDFAFHELVSSDKRKDVEGQRLFSDLGEEVFIPEPVKEYPLVHFLKVADAEQQ